MSSDNASSSTENSRSYHISFAQRTGFNWLKPGTDTDSPSANLFSSGDNAFSLNHHRCLIENNHGSSGGSLLRLSNVSEFINLLNFHTLEIKVTVNKSLNEFYKLEYVVVKNETSAPTAAPADFYERFVPSSNEENVYTFSINKVIRVLDVSKDFIFGFSHRGADNLSTPDIPEGSDESVEVDFDPFNTEIIKMNISGKSITNSVFMAKTIAHKQYRKRIYIYDSASAPQGCLAYSHIIEKNNPDATTTVYRLNLTNQSVLYNILVSGNDTSNNTTVKRLNLSGGHVVLRQTSSGTTIEYAQVEVHEDSVEFVPDANKLLTITMAPAT
jgi:hypothetical protein